MEINTFNDLNIGDKIELGEYTPSGNNPEKITWMVVGKNFKDYPDCVTLISDKILDCKFYDTNKTNLNWDTCDLRQWLNSKDGFLKYFNDKEYALIETSNVKTKTYNDFKYTTDKVFLISNEEFDQLDYFLQCNKTWTTPSNPNNYDKEGKRDVRKTTSMTQSCWDNLPDNNPNSYNSGYNYEGEQRTSDEIYQNKPRNSGDYWWWWCRHYESYETSLTVASDFYHYDLNAGYTSTTDCFAGNITSYLGNSYKAGIRPLINIKLDKSPNRPPLTPSFITHDASVPKTLNDAINITWGASTDPDNDSITYDLYYFNGKNWVGIKSGLNDLVYTHTIPITSYNCTTAKYKIRAFDGDLYSDFVESSPFELYGVKPLNSPPTIKAYVYY